MAECQGVLKSKLNSSVGLKHQAGASDRQWSNTKESFHISNKRQDTPFGYKNRTGHSRSTSRDTHAPPSYDFVPVVWPPKCLGTKASEERAKERAASTVKRLLNMVIRRLLRGVSFDVKLKIAQKEDNTAQNIVLLQIMNLLATSTR